MMSGNSIPATYQPLTSMYINSQESLMQEYINADQYIHQISQIIAKANRSYVPKKADDSHTNLYYDPVSEKILGRWIRVDSGKIMLALDLNAYQFEIIDDRLRVLNEFPITGETTTKLESDIADALVQIGLDASGFAQKLHFEITEYPFKNDPFKSLSGTGVRQWKKFRKLVNEASLHFLGYLQAESEIRIWPHHFDTGVYAEVHDGLGIGFGLAMADGIEASPYFYLSGYALDDSALKFENLPKIETGRWEIGEHWKGAILPMDALMSLEEKELSDTVYDFIIVGCKFYLHQ
jgi:hypothetical protein